MTMYHMNAAGFVRTFDNVVEMQNWYDALKAERPWIIGQPVAIHKGEGSHECATYDSTPVLQAIIPA